MQAEGVQSCQFCEEPATITRLIAYQDGKQEMRSVCQWHDTFFGWTQNILARLTQERLRVKQISEDTLKSKFR